jgi:hypothetical protein
MAAIVALTSASLWSCVLDFDQFEQRGGAGQGGATSSASGGAGGAAGNPATGGSGGAPTFDPGEVGGPCLANDMCNAGECCTADQCIDSCMTPCGDASECPQSGMGCAHGYCFYPCNDDDDDCMQPDYTCQHGGRFCER